MRFLTRLISTGITILLIGLAVLLALSNPHETSVSFWPFESQINLPVWLLVLISFGSGLIIGGMAMLAPLFGSKLAQRKLQKTVNKLEKSKTDKSDQQTLTKSLNDHAGIHGGDNG